jgi:hypothetical protein
MRLLRFALIAFAFFAVTVHSSDFPRFTHNPPRTYHENAPDLFLQMAECGFNLIWNSGWAYDDLEEYLKLLYYHDMRAVLRQGKIRNSNNYKVEFYSRAQYDRYEVERDYDEALTLGEYGYYHFWHGASARSRNGERLNSFDGAEGVWACMKDVHDSGVILKGPYETSQGKNREGGWRSQTAWHRYREPRDFKTIVRVKIDPTQLSSTSDRVLRIRVIKEGNRNRDKEVLADTTCIGAFFHMESRWTDIEVNYTVPDCPDTRGRFRIQYDVQWFGNCDIWIDYIEYMDMERAYSLFYDNWYRDRTVDAIVSESRAIEEQYGDMIFGWIQSGEPVRASFRAHRLVSEMVAPQLSKPLLTTFNQTQYENGALFVDMADPAIFVTDQYLFRDDDKLKGQEELDSLASSIEAAYQATRAQDPPVNLWVTLQGQLGIINYYKGSPTFTRLRTPTCGELFAETYIALAHGAKGIGFWKYTSTPRSQWTDFYEGLLDTLHQPTEKWKIVKKINTQLDALGDLLLSLERDTAYCAYDGVFVPPVAKVEFKNDRRDYIEIGQFHDPQGIPYLILVNRRTNKDRYIDLCLTDSYRNRGVILEDLYTGEKFIGNGCKFPGIFFEPGQGRVFKIIGGG